MNNPEQETKSRTWQWWERDPNPPPFQLQPRDTEIVRAVFRYRFLRPAHIHALFPDGSPANLNRRLALLWHHGYLERPKALRPSKALTEEIVYALGKKGARHLEHLDPAFRIGHLDWTETPKKQVGWPYVDHQLGVATFMVAMQLACNRLGHRLLWAGHFDRRRHRIRVPRDTHPFLPDAYFVLERREDGKQAHHFLEFDRGNASLKAMHHKYERYFLWWKQGAAGSAFKHFRVLTVAEDPDHVDALRRAAIPVGRDRDHASTWKALMFTHRQAFSLEDPKRILSPIFCYADEESSISLV